MKAAIALVLMMAVLAISCGSSYTGSDGWFPRPPKDWVAVRPYMAPGENYDDPPYRVVFLVNWDAQLDWQPNEHGVLVPERMVIDPDGDGPMLEQEVDLSIPGTSLPPELLDLYVGYRPSDIALTFLEVDFEEPGDYTASFKVYDRKGLYAEGGVFPFTLPRELKKCVAVSVTDAPGAENIGLPPYRMLATITWSTAPYWERNAHGILVPQEVRILVAPAVLPEPEPTVTLVDLDSLTKHGYVQATIELTCNGRNIVTVEVLDAEGFYATASCEVYPVLPPILPGP